MTRYELYLAGALALTASAPCAPAQVTAHRFPVRIDETQAVTLAGNVHPLARAEFDMGVVGADMRLERMVLELEPSAAQQAALDALVEAQQDPASPLFQHWLTPAEFGSRFGAGAQDVSRVTAWLAGHGFTVEEIPAGNRLVVFSGTAEQVYEAFHTEIHRYDVDGVPHLANSQDPQIPASLAGVVGGVVSLHDFRRSSAIAVRTPLSAKAAGGARPLYSAGSTHYLFPADFAAIYDLNSLYTAGTAGAGTSIAIAGRSNINVSDVAAFRSLSGLTANNPSVVLPGANPGLVKNDQDESTLDVEWAGAVAPAAAVTLVASPSTSTTDGVDLAAAYIVNHKTAPVVSVSYGSCEQSMGASELAFYNNLWEQAASEGMSVFVASGDAGAAGCAAASSSKGSGAGVNGLCSSAYSTCVGGTEFNEGSNPAQYWSSANSAGYGSALGYIPEEVWNESEVNGGTGLWASGGGRSAVYAQPDWQAAVSGAGAANGMRGVPDVAMAAATHDGYMVYENNSYWIVSGTSAAAPSFAGVMALVVEKMGGVGQGSANPALYSLVNANRNPFHATPSGNNSVPGVAGFTASGAAYNLATGLGSVDGEVLVNGWGASAAATPPTLALASSSNLVTVVAGGSATVNLTVTTGGAFTGSVGFQVSGLRPGVTARWPANPVVPATGASSTVVTLTLTASTLAMQGSASFVVTASGDGLVASESLVVQVSKPQTCSGVMRLLGSRCFVPAPVPVRLRFPTFEPQF